MTEVERLVRLARKGGLTNRDLMLSLRVGSSQFYSYVNNQRTPNSPVMKRITNLANKIEKAIEAGYFPIDKYLRP